MTTDDAQSTLAPVAVGEKLKLTRPIWDDETDWHRPTCLAVAGEVVAVVGMKRDGVRVVADRPSSSQPFSVYRDEFVRIEG